jgi:hypothetical protein
MKIHYVLVIFALLNIFAQCDEPKETVYPNDSIRFSQDFLLAIKIEQPYQAYRDTLSIIDLESLKSDLNTKEKKLAFWINTYNSLVQSKIRDNVDAFKDQDKFFKTADQSIGHMKLSLDQIENGILRRKEVKENKDFIDSFKLDELEPRIHFTLNCGATSCPPIAYYSDENIEEQLAMAEDSFVKGTSKFDKASNTLEISELFDWFEEDFNGVDGVLSIMKRLEIIPEDANPNIIYTPYNWNLDLENY